MTADRPVAAAAPRTQQAVARNTSAAQKPPSAVWIAAAIALLLAPSAVWILRDHSVWPWDQAWYGQVATDLWFAATHSLRAWGANMLFAMDIKPPAVAWIGQFFVPLRGILGSVENALLFSILMTQGALLWIVFKIGEAMPASRLVSFTGVLFVAGTQAFARLSHQMFVEPLQALCVAWVVYIAAECRNWPAARTAVHLACALLLGLAAKATTPVYCLLFVVYIGAVLISGRSRPDLAAEWRHWPSRILMCLFAPASLATAVWYAINFRAVWRHARDSSTGDLALDYGYRAPLGQKLQVWLHLYYQSFLSPYLLWAALAAVLIAAAFYIARAKRWTPPAALMWLSAAQSALLLLIFASSIAVDARYMYALVVCLASLFMGACTWISSRLVLAVLVLLCALQWGTVHAVGLGAWEPVANQFEWLAPPLADRSQFDELARVVRETSRSNQWMNFIGVEEPWLNANSAEFFAAKQSLTTGVRSHYTTLGYAEKSVETALQCMASFQAHYVATLDESHLQAKPNFLNLVALPVLRAMKDDPRFQQIPFASNKGILIFERR